MTEVGPARPRYAVFDAIGGGGMATVHLGRQLGAAGFSKTVAVKRLRPEHVRDAEFVAMFADEARLAARVRHPNVAQTLDVVGEGGELFLVLEYVHGASLDALVEGARALGERVPPDVASALLVGALAGLHAAHVARAEGGAPLEIVHRDVSPQNVLVGADGVARLIDFGIAKASVRLRSTRDGKLKGKLPYMAPEQLAGDEATALSDLYSAGVLLWELLAGRRLFDAPNEGALLAKVLEGRVPPLAPFAPQLPASLGPLVARALAREPRARFRSAREMAVALELALHPASPRKVGEWVERVAGTELARRAERVAAVERETAVALGGGEARVSLALEARPAPLLALAPAPLLALAPAPLLALAPAAALPAPGRRAGPDGATATMTVSRAASPRVPGPEVLAPLLSPASAEPPALTAPAPRSPRPSFSGRALVAAALALGALPLAWRAVVAPAVVSPPAAERPSLAAPLRSPEAASLAAPRRSLEARAEGVPPLAGRAEGAPALEGRAEGFPAPDAAARPSAEASPAAAPPGAAAPHARRSAAPPRGPARKPAAPRPPADAPAAAAPPPPRGAPGERPRCDPPY